MKLKTKKIIAEEGLILIGSLLAIWIYWTFKKDAQRLEIVGFWVLSNLIIRFFFWAGKTLRAKNK